MSAAIGRLVESIQTEIRMYILKHTECSEDFKKGMLEASRIVRSYYEC